MVVQMRMPDISLLDGLHAQNVTVLYRYIQYTSKQATCRYQYLPPAMFHLWWCHKVRGMRVYLTNPHMVNAGQHHPCNGNNRLFLATAFCEMLISNHKIKLFSAFYSGKDTLDELWLEILPCLGVPGKFFLAGTLIICRVQGQAQPRNTDSCQIQ